MSEDLKYKEVKRMTREEILEALASQKPERIQTALWSAANFDQDWRWVQDQCLRYLTFPDLWVRRSAATCLGILAVFHKKLDVERVIPKLEDAGRDEEVRPFVQDSLEDIHHHIKRGLVG
jgi:hypothetical protein